MVRPRRLAARAKRSHADVYQAHRSARSITGKTLCFCYFWNMCQSATSDIQVRSSEYAPCRLTVHGSAEQPTIWIDDAVGLPLATLRLSTVDAETLVAALVALLLTGTLAESLPAGSDCTGLPGPSRP